MGFDPSDASEMPTETSDRLADWGRQKMSNDYTFRFENQTSQTVYIAYLPAGRVEKGGSCDSSVGVKGRLAVVTASAKKSNRRNWVVKGGLQVDVVRPGQVKPVFVSSDQIEYWAAFKDQDEFCFFKMGLSLHYRRHTTKIFHRGHADEVTHEVGGAGSMKSAMEKLRKDEDRYFIGEGSESESESDSDNEEDSDYDSD